MAPLDLANEKHLDQVVQTTQTVHQDLSNEIDLCLDEIATFLHRLTSVVMTTKEVLANQDHHMDMESQDQAEHYKEVQLVVQEFVDPQVSEAYFHHLPSCHDLKADPTNSLAMALECRTLPDYRHQCHHP